MTKDEAQEVFRTLAVIYDLHPERTSEQAPTWTAALEPLPIEETMSVVAQFLKGNGPEKFPNVVQFVGIVKRLIDRREEASKPKLQELEADELQKPVWVWAWEILRERGDRSVLPEQEGGFFQLAIAWPPTDRRLINADSDEYRELMEEARARAGATPPKKAIVERDPDCLACRDTGWVEVGYSVTNVGNEMVRGSEQVAPCPRCDKGKLIEHPLEGVGPFGEDGFWKGQPYQVVRSGVVELTAR